MFTIEKKEEGKKLELVLSGRLDTTTAPDLEAVIKKDLADVTTLVLDLKDLEYVSSAGLRQFLAAQKVMGKQGEMRIRNANEGIKSIFSVTGFMDIFTLEE